ncbi:glycosyltransferase family 2 protein [Arthrobacter sp. B10-11]|uniref:glycosyltransferase family 2 protein n=1 Tax=Arthrobacter sp. B10-11 TaxID=3081160 RepID=UPI0029551EE6|nr:glycosyltransferase family 2 protein [Arthrobacter sp. B10-11]MDV8146990.1 glycosyltransferase family 2 protein [Arthrobacter sp. B10-11]
MTQLSRSGIDVVVVTYNSATYLPRLASSLRSIDEIRSVTIVDNDSKDDSADIAERQDWGCSLSVLRSDSNPGFGKSMNLGASHQSNPHDLILILNPDVYLTEQVLKGLSRNLVEDPTLGTVGPVLTTPDGKAVSSARDFPTPKSIAMRYFVDAKHNARLTDVDWICGASMLWRREAFEQLNGFAEEFFLYFEDVDICRRASSAGWGVAVNGSLTAVHDQGHGRKTSRFLRRQSRISRRRYAQKWFGHRGVLAALVADATDWAADIYHARQGK